MRVSRWTVSCVALVATIALVGTPTAQADDDGFVRDVESIGFVHGPENRISTAQSACYFLGRNRTPFEVERRIVRYLRVEPAQAHQFLVLAVAEYCPQYVGAIGV